MAADDPRTEYPWITSHAWPAWDSAHRDARAELLCTAHADVTQLVEIRADKDAWIPALRELARLGLIEFLELERWDLPREQLLPLSTETASALMNDPARWDPDSDEPRVFFSITEKGRRAVEAEAFHFNDGRFVEWRDTDKS